MRKKLNASEFAALNMPLSEYNTRDINQAIAQAAEISKHYPAAVYYDVDIDDGGMRFEYTTIQLTHPTLTLSIKYDWDVKKKYSIFCNTIHTLKNIDTDTRTKIENSNSNMRPQYMGVLSTKKINDWVNYWTEVYNQLSIINENNGFRKAEFLERLTALNAHFNREKTGGYLKKNGIELTFNVTETTVYTQVRLAAYDNSLDAFIKLSDNKFIDRA